MKPFFLVLKLYFYKLRLSFFVYREFDSIFSCTKCDCIKNAILYFRLYKMQVYKLYFLNIYYCKMEAIFINLNDFRNFVYFLYQRYKMFGWKFDEENNRVLNVTLKITDCNRIFFVYNARTYWTQKLDLIANSLTINL